MEKTYTVRVWVSGIGWLDAQDGVALSYLSACELKGELTGKGKTVHIICDCHGVVLTPGNTCEKE